MAQESSRPPIACNDFDVGKLTTEERTRAIQNFKSDDDVIALLCSSRVGGEGLTLTEANHVMLHQRMVESIS